MVNNHIKGWKRLFKAGLYSWKGVCALWHHEAAFRQEIIALGVAILIVALLDFNVIESVLLIGSVFMVLIVEALNSAIEAVVDRTGFEHHPLAGRAKDMGSAAVLISIIMALFVWVALFWKYV